MDKNLLFVLALLGSALESGAQGVAINTDGSSPDASALLDVKSNDKGVLVPRVNLSNVNWALPITNPATGLLVYNTNPNVTGGNGTGFYFWTGSAWTRLDNSNSGDWRLTGNASTNPATHFLGTTDAQDLVFRTNNTERLRIVGSGSTQTELRLAGTASNLILYNTSGVAAPTTGSRSAGTKVVWYPQVSATEVDYATGIEGSTLWHSVPGATSAYQHRFYAGTQRLMDLRGNNQTLLYGSGDNVFNPPVNGFTTLNVEGSIFMPSGSSLWIGNTGDVSDRFRFHHVGSDSYIDYATGFLQFRSGTTDRVRFTSDGRVGIGTTNPVQLLDVNGRMAVQNGVIQRGTTPITVTNDLGLYSQPSGHWIRIASNNAPIKFFTDQGGGNSAGTNAIMSIEPGNGGGIQINAEISGTGNAGAPPARAALDVTSTSKGVLIPRMTTAQRDAMGVNLPEALMIYNTTTDCFEFWDTRFSVPGGNGFWNSLCDHCQNLYVYNTNSNGNNFFIQAGSPSIARRWCVYVNPGVTLGAASPGGVALDFSGLPGGSQVILYNYGSIVGGGGSGGNGGQESDGICPAGDTPGGGGQAGGAAILSNGTVRVIVYNYGLIAGGGGGGGGGSGGCRSRGGGGGGGRGIPGGNAGLAPTSGGEKASGFGCLSCTSAGAGATNGTAGSPSAPGTGGCSTGNSGGGCLYSGYNGGCGGNGGDYGAPGANGTGGNCGSAPAGWGGAGGPALNGNGGGASLTNYAGGVHYGSVIP